MTTNTPHFNILVISDYRSVSSSRPEAEIFIRLAQMGHRVDILSHPQATYYNERFRSFGINVIENHPVKKTSPAYIRYLRKILHDNQYDFLHAFNSKGLTNAVWAVRGLKTKLIAYRGYAGQTHWYDPTMYLKYFHPGVDHIICVSEDITRILSRNMVSGKKKLTTIPKGHDSEWYNEILPLERHELGSSPGDVLVAFLANVRPFKGLTYLLKATHLLPRELPFKFLFIGQGYDDPAIQQEINESPLKDRFMLLGYRTDALRVLAASDCLVLASTHGEGLSKSVVESMFLGIAPVITAIPGNTGILVDGESGWMVPVKDPQAIATALIEMASDEAERKRRGANAKEHMRLHFHIDQTVAGFLRLYGRLKSF